MAEIAPGIHRLGRKLHNFYLVVEGGKATVIDAGGLRELPLLEGALAALGLTLDAVEALLVTHAHTDHLGFARETARRGVPVTVHEDEAAYALGRVAGTQIGPTELPWWRPRVMVFLVEMVRAGAHRDARLDTVETVQDGDRLDLPGRPRVVATPGHTAGHAAYLLEAHRAVCTGDALVTDALTTRTTGPQLLAAPFHQDVDQARRSLERLAPLDADLVLPGHGAPWRGSIADAVTTARTR